MDSKIKVKYPIAVQWKIAETRLQEKRNSTNGYLMSTVFDIPGTDVQYYVAIYPNGQKERRGQTWIFLQLDFKEKNEIEAEFTISIESANISKEEKFVYKETAGYGGQICTVDELFDHVKQYIVDGKLDIKIEGFMVIEKKAPEKSHKFGENSLCIDLWNQEFKDFTIIADGKEIHAHKLILSTRSPVFAAMFKPHTKEAKENKVVIPDFSFEIVETAIKLCYDPKLVENIPTEDMIFLLQFFDKYDIQILKTDLEHFMIHEVDELTVCRLANSSILSNSQKLRKNVPNSSKNVTGIVHPLMTLIFLTKILLMMCLKIHCLNFLFKFHIVFFFCFRINIFFDFCEIQIF